MKSVFSSHSELCHVYAQNDQNNGRAGNMFFENGTLYSYGYHFPICKFIEDKGEIKVLFTLDSYSVSTSKHLNYALSALSHYPIIYTYDVDHPENSRKRAEKEIKHNLKKLGKARKPQKYIDEILREAGRIENLQKYFNFKVYKKDYPNLYNVLKHGEAFFTPEVLNKAKKQAKKEAAERRKQAEREAKKLKTAIKDWKNFERQNIPFISGNKAFLRYNSKTDNIETSKSVRIPALQAKTLFKTWVEDPSKLQGAKVDNRYTINKATKEALFIGCHTISKQEAQQIAKKLNW